MDSTFIYTESARRKVNKMKALAEGAAEQGLPPGTPPPASGTPVPVAARPPRAARKTVRPIQTGAAAGARPPAIRRPAGAETIGGGLYKKGQAKQATAVPRPAGAQPARAERRARTPATGLKANEERLLLESKELDLFGTGTRSKVCICPDCQHEVVKVVCLGTPVRACLDCKGVWLSYPVVREFAREQEWFLQLGPAIQLEIDKKKKTGL
jgi:hypothetical protein